MQLLREDAPATVDVLAERLGVSRRTVFRDLTTIRQAGGVVTHELGRGYRLTGLGMSEPPQLGASEALALTVL
ncbi:MAG: helix-turn-helix domain-containing protein, partial [Planctomycetota bacterium]